MISSQRFFVSRDVAFKEHVFPFLLLKDGDHHNPMFLDIKGHCTGFPAPETISIDAVVLPASFEVTTISTPIVVPTSYSTSALVSENTPGVLPPRMRKSTRRTKPLVWFKDFLHPANWNAACSYPMSKYLSYSSVSSRF